MVWRVPGLNQLIKLMSWMFWGDFGVWSHVKVRELRERSLVSQISVSNMTQRPGHFIFQLSYQWKI